MIHKLGAGIIAVSVLAMTALMPVQPAAAQNALGGALVGGTLGGLIGGALGHGGGAVAGAVAGAAAGGIIASQAQPRPGGYYWWHGACYYRYPNGAWSPPLTPDYCGY